jgi:hypothetical protein
MPDRQSGHGHASLEPDGSPYIIEFRMHPPKRSFENMVKMAMDAGLVVTEMLRRLSSRAIVLKSTS